jgi:hypothetical protein
MTKAPFASIDPSVRIPPQCDAPTGEAASRKRTDRKRPIPEVQRSLVAL